MAFFPPDTNNSFGLSPEANTALGLLGISLMQGKGGFGQGAANALQYMAGADERKLKMGLLGLQMQEAQAGLEDRRLKRQQEVDLTKAAKDAYVTPDLARQLSTGPFPGGELREVKPGFNSDQFLGRAWTIDPMKALSIQQTLQKDTPFGKVDAQHFTPESIRAFQQSGGRDYGQLRAAPKTENLPAALQEYQFAVGQGYRGTFDQWDKERKKAGANNVSVAVNTEKSYGGEFGKLVAQQDASAIDAARSAPQRVQTAQQVMRILDTQAPITGTGADARLAVTKALSTAGLLDGQTVKSTEDLASLLASQTLDAIKTSGLGGGQGFTDKDRQFLERARSGNIEMNAGTLRTLAALNEKAGRAAIARGREVSTRLRANKDLGWVTHGLDIEDPPQYLGPSVVRKPPTGATPSIDDLLKKYGGG